MHGVAPAGLAALFLGLRSLPPSYALAIIRWACCASTSSRRVTTAGAAQTATLSCWLRVGLIALAFFLPAFATVGVQVPRACGGWETRRVNSSVGLFGAAGLLGVGWAVVSARQRRHPVPLSDGLGATSTAGPSRSLIVYGLLFVRLPDEASYPACATLACTGCCAGTRGTSHSGC